MRCSRAAAVSIAPVSRCRSCETGGGLTFRQGNRAQYPAMASLIALAVTDSRITQLDWLRSVIVCGCALTLIFADLALPTLGQALGL